MKKYLLFLALFLMAAVPASFAFSCKAGNSLNSDECWTEGYYNETTALSAGSVMVVSTGATSVFGNVSIDGYYVRKATTSLDNVIVGVTQETYSSADLPARVRIQKLGKGKVRAERRSSGELSLTEIVSGDQVRVWSSTGNTGVVAELTDGDSGRGLVGKALSNEEESGTDNLIDVYIDTI